MYDAASLSDPLVHQRARGALRVSFRLRDGETVLDGLRQEGCLKARFPRPERDAWTSTVMLNSSGGVAGGDVLSAEVCVGAGARATVATQAAERFYRALPGTPPSTVRNRVNISEGAAAEWLPQETILFDRCAMERRLDVSLAPNGWFLGVEALLFGRAAMGETVRQAALRDTIRVRRGGALVLHDAIRLDGAVDALLARAATMASARALATIVHVAPDAETHLDGMREALASTAAESGASAWDGMLVARILAADGAALRAATTTGLHALRGSRPLPRVWLC